MAAIKVPTSFNIDVEFEIPEFYRRLLALLIDILIQFCYFKIAIEIYDSIRRGGDFSDVDTNNNLEAIGVLLFFATFYLSRSAGNNYEWPKYWKKNNGNTGST